MDLDVVDDAEPNDLVQMLVDGFRWVDPGPDSDHLVSDCSGWWRSAAVLRLLGPALAAPYRVDPPTVVIAAEVTGLLLGPLVATDLGAGFVAAHKQQRDERRLAGPVTWVTAGSDHRGRRLTLGVRPHLRPDDRVLVVDDWVSTGAQARAIFELVERAGARPIGCAAVVSQCPPGVARELRLHALLHADQLPVTTP